MADERGKWQRLRLVAPLLVVNAVAVASAVTATASLVSGDHWDWSRFWWFVVLVFLSSGASSAGRAIVRRGAFGSNGQAQRRFDEDEQTARTLRTGVLPLDADPERWRARIRRRLSQAVGIAAFSTALCVSAAVLTATAARLNNDDNPVLWVLAVVMLLFLPPLFWLVMRVRRRGRHLLARL